MDEPNYNITNADGELVGQVGADGNGNPVVSKPGGATVTITDNGIETPAVSTGDLDTGRTWTDVQSSRSVETQYTNSSNSEIAVGVKFSPSADSTTVVARIRVGGVEIDRRTGVYDSTDQMTIVAPAVPAGATYEVNTFGDTGDFSILAWNEFRT